MKKHLSFIVTSVLVLQAAPLVVFGAVLDNLQLKREEAKQEIQQKRDELKASIQQKRDELKAAVHEKRDTLKQEMQGRVQNLKGEIKDNRQDAKAAMDGMRAAVRDQMREKREAVRTEIKEKREEFIGAAATRREELKKKLGAEKAKRIEQFFNNMVQKFERAIDRLHDLEAKVEDRIEKASLSGKDVARAKEALAVAKIKIAESESALSDAKAKYTEAVSDPDFKASFAKVKGVVEGVSAKVRAAHASLVNVVTALRGLGGGNTATTTPTQN